MRIALVYRAFHLGGSLPRFHVELARYLSSRGHDVHVYSRLEGTEPGLAPDCTFHAVPVAAVAAGAGFSSRELRSFARNAATMLEGERYDIVHVRAPSTWVGDVLHLPGVQRGESELAGHGTARWLATRLRHPGNQARYALERRAIRNPRFARFHTEAPIVRDHLMRFYGIDEAAIRVIPPGVNTAEFSMGDRQEARRSLGLQAVHGPLVLFCGHDFERKGLDRAIQAAASSRAGFELVVVGGNADQARFESLARACGVRDRVHFFGARSDAATFFRAADAFVLPSRSDVWGATVIEAMACGIPPVVSAAVGASTVIVEAVDGFVLPEPLDTQRLAAALDAAVSSPDRLAMAHRCRATAVQFSTEAHGRRVERDLEEIVAGRPTNPNAERIVGRHADRPVQGEAPSVPGDATAAPGREIDPAGPSG